MLDHRFRNAFQMNFIIVKYYIFSCSKWTWQRCRWCGNSSKKCKCWMHTNKWSMCFLVSWLIQYASIMQFEIARLLSAGVNKIILELILIFIDWKWIAEGAFLNWQDDGTNHCSHLRLQNGTFSWWSNNIHWFWRQPNTKVCFDMDRTSNSHGLVIERLVYQRKCKVLLANSTGLHYVMIKRL